MTIAIYDATHLNVGMLLHANKNNAQSALEIYNTNTTRSIQTQSIAKKLGIRVRVTYWGGLGRLAVWHLPRGPVGAESRWAATSNVEVGQTTYPINTRGAGRGKKGPRDKVTKLSLIHI